MKGEGKGVAKDMVKRLMQTAMGLVGLMLRKIGLARDALSLEASLKRCQKRGGHFGTIVDVGASNGCWARRARRFFSDALLFLVEAQPTHEPALARFRADLQHVDYVMAAAGDCDGEIYFDAADPFGGVASHTPFPGCLTVPVRTIDSLVRERGLQPPFLLKLDTHGFEVPILEGARETLKETGLIVVETYNFKVAAESLRFHEMCSWMEERGFRCIDLCEPMHRPKDGVFWQVDLFFAPAERGEFNSNSYE